jgi:cytidyltransferase-like protein
VYTIGCFDLFHRGHQNVLNSLREFGYFIVAGIHDDESYFQLKNKYTIDNLERRMKNVKPFVDQLFVIPSTNPDLFHRGHQNVLNSLREFGYFIVAGIHDDESYFQLKNKYTIDNLGTRMKNVKPFVDQLFVIPSTNPDIFLKCMVSEQDILTGSCCYARGDDMLNFPGREWVESVMPVHFVPRTESCSSSLLRTIYHSEDPELAKKAAFAVTNYDGKPIDENGNVLKQ